MINSVVSALAFTARASLSGSVGCAFEVTGSTPTGIGNILSWILIMNIFYGLLSLPLIQEGQLSVSGERMCTTLVNCLED